MTHKKGRSVIRYRTLNTTLSMYLGIMFFAAASNSHAQGFEKRDAEFREQIYSRADIFEELDVNNDGFLSETEYNGTAKLFRDLDTDGDDLLSTDESEYMMTFGEVPAGRFIMGTDETVHIRPFPFPQSDLAPAVEVYMDAFKMSSTEITNAQYVLFLNSALEAGELVVRLGTLVEAQIRYHLPIPTYIAEGSPGTKYEGKIFTALNPTAGISHIKSIHNYLPMPEHPFNQSWIKYSPKRNVFYVLPGMEDWPAVFLQWWGAKAFAEYYDMSLPTEAEWEYAAAAGDNQFPFATSDGTTSCQRSNHRCYNTLGLEDYTGVETPDEFVGFRLPVGSYPANPFGLYDLAGSIWEWTEGWYKADFYQYLLDNGITRNPKWEDGEEPPRDATGGPGRPFSHDVRVLRGGSYNYPEQVTTPYFRFPAFPWLGNDHIGGRVVLRPSTTEFNGKD